MRVRTSFVCLLFANSPEYNAIWAKAPRYVKIGSQFPKNHFFHIFFQLFFSKFFFQKFFFLSYFFRQIQKYIFTYFGLSPIMHCTRRSHAEKRTVYKIWRARDCSRIKNKLNILESTQRRLRKHRVPGTTLPRVYDVTDFPLSVEEKTGRVTWLSRRTNSAVLRVASDSRSRGTPARPNMSISPFVFSFKFLKRIIDTGDTTGIGVGHSVACGMGMNSCFK